MTRSRLPSHVAAGAFALALAPAFWPSDAAAHTCDDPFSTDLIAGQKINAGEVKVCNDDTILTVTYETTYPWCLLETNLHVATIPDPPADPDANIPQNRPGNPIPGHFAYGDEHDCEGTVAFAIPLDEIDGGVEPGDTVVIAAHAGVDNGKREEGAWGDGTRFVERGPWAMYFTYEVQEPSCDQEGGSCLVFVTSGTFDGNLGGLQGADEKCQAEADAAGQDGTFKAWLSTDGAGNSAADRLNQASVPYVLVGGDRVADDWADLTDCASGDCLQHAIDQTLASSRVGPSPFVWTGTDTAGECRGCGIVDCVGWAQLAHFGGNVGSPVDVSSRWTRVIFAEFCAVEHRLYCFEQ